MEDFAVENVMRALRENIKEKKLCSSDLSFTSRYHHKFMQELKKLDEIVLFGAGRHGEMLYDDIIQHGIDTVRCFCDNKAAGQMIKGMQVLLPRDAVSQYPDAYYVITPNDFQNEILLQLVDMGIRVNHIRLFNMLNTGLIL